MSQPTPEQSPSAFVPKSMSFSRATMVDECSMLYKLVNVDRLVEKGGDTDATRLGKLCHESIENQLNDETGTVISPYDELVKPGGIWDRELTKHNLMELKGRLQAYAHHTTSLYERATARYKGADAIRKADGSVALAADKTKGWTEYVKAHGLDGMAAQIDQLAAKAAPKHWKDVSLAKVYSATLGIMYPYRHPAEIDRVVAVELPFSEFWFQAADDDGKALFEADGVTPVPTTRQRGPHPVYEDPETKKPVFVRLDNPWFMPKVDAFGKLIKTDAVDAEGKPLVYERRDDMVLTAYIDLISRGLPEEAPPLDVIDHKSSSGETPSVEKVARHEQCNIYGLMVMTQYGQKPDRIGINWLKQHKLVLAPFDVEVAEASMELFLSRVSNIEKGAFQKQHIDGFHSKCVRKSEDPRRATRICPGLVFCWPSVAAQYGMFPPERKQA